MNAFKAFPELYMLIKSIENSCVSVKKKKILKILVDTLYIFIIGKKKLNIVVVQGLPVCSICKNMWAFSERSV